MCFALVSAVGRLRGNVRGLTEPTTKTKKAQQGDTKMGRFIAFMSDESGATAIEYGLLAALISIAAIAAMSAVGTNLSTAFSTVANSL
jgi:pilus assembly protein Flp/PilA